MSEKQNKFSRRNLLKTIGAAGIGSMFASTGCSTGRSREMSSSEYPQVPVRTLGKTGVRIPCIALGTVYNMIEHQPLLDASLKYGINYWDTATNYGDTKSQQGIGIYLKKHPEVRKKLFIVSKPIDLEDDIPDVRQFEEDLHESLARMNTSYFDLYCGLHGMWDAGQLTDDVRKWAQSAKKRGLIKYFGFSTHSNMPQCLQAASKCDWIDAVLTAYNFHWMQNENMQQAINACRKKGIGLVAIKTQRKTTLEPLNIETEEDKKLTRHFFKEGFTEGQAKLKAVLDDERITAAAVGMDDIGLLMQNVAAALDKTKLSEQDKIALKEYDRATCNRYCAGCSHICNSAVPQAPYVSDIMRYMMYYNSYGHKRRAKKQFAKIPQRVREKLPKIDFSKAEGKCPNNLPIGKIVSEAVRELA